MYTVVVQYSMYRTRAHTQHLPLILSFALSLSLISLHHEALPVGKDSRCYVLVPLLVLSDGICLFTIHDGCGFTGE